MNLIQKLYVIFSMTFLFPTDPLPLQQETLTAEVDALKRRAEARRQAQEAAAQSMEVETSAILMAS